MKRLKTSLLPFLLLIAALLSVRAQLPQGFTGKKFILPYQDRETKELKAIFTGLNAKQITGSKVLITEFGMKTFRDGDTNKIELIAQAPECLFDRSTAVATSAGTIKAYTLTTNLFIQGEGFYCQQSNAFLVISNKVETVIRKDTIKQRNGELKTASPAPDLPPATNQVLKIFADHFLFLYESNLVTYTGNVRVDDVQMELTCDLLSIELSSDTTNKGIRQITADNHVVVRNKKDNSRASGEHAIYIVNTNQETIALTGNPKWEDGQRVGTADLFFFDRRSNVFRAEQNAKFKMPREQLGQPDLLNANAAARTNALPNQFVEITSDLMTFKLAETNGTVQQIIADSNVVMLSESDQSRATGRRAVYTEATGLMELTGNPEWRIKESRISAEILIVGKTNRYFAARTNVQMRMPANLFARNAGSTNAADIAKRMADVFCEDFSYGTNTANFTKNVRANLTDENDSLTTLLCDFTTISFGAGNQVEKVVANGNIVLQEIPGAAAKTNLLKKILTCQSLTLNRSIETGLITSVHAEKDVVAEQIEKIPLGERLERISGDFMDVKFQPRTNQISSVIGHGNMVAQKIDRIGDLEKIGQAFGERAAYDAVTQTVELTGTPSAKMDGMLIYDAKFLRWGLKSGKVSANPYKIIPLNATNALKAFRKP